MIKLTLQYIALWSVTGGFWPITSSRAGRSYPAKPVPTGGPTAKGLPASGHSPPPTPLPPLASSAARHPTPPLPASLGQEAPRLFLAGAQKIVSHP